MAGRRGYGFARPDRGRIDRPFCQRGKIKMAEDFGLVVLIDKEIGRARRKNEFMLEHTTFFTPSPWTRPTASALE